MRQVADARRTEAEEFHKRNRDRVSKYRGELKGMAILWVVFFHATLSTTGLMRDVQKLGYGGVDIFLFLTGFGLFYSLQRNEDLHDYWKRRMKRILPAYIPFVLLWMLCMFPQYGQSLTQGIRSVAGNLTMTAFWLNTPKVFNWYVSILMLVIALAPFLYAQLIRSERPHLTLGKMLCIAFCVGLACIGDDRYMGVSRIPIFILGMAFAMDWKPVISKAFLRFFYIVTFVAGLAVALLSHARYTELLNTYAMYWHPFVLITPGLCVVAAWALDKINKNSILMRLLCFFGEASFEIYLFNIWLVEFGKRWKMEGNWPWIGLSVASVLLGVAYHLLITKVMAFVEKKRWH